MLQVALKGLWGRRGGRPWGRETGGRRGDDVNMKEKVKAVGVSFWGFFVFEEPENKSFYLFGSSEEAVLDLAFWWADCALCVV